MAPPEGGRDILTKLFFNEVVQPFERGKRNSLSITHYSSHGNQSAVLRRALLLHSPRKVAAELAGFKYVRLD